MVTKKEVENVSMPGLFNKICIRSALTTRLDSTQLAHGLSSGVFDFFAETETDWHSGTYITKPRKFRVRPGRPKRAERTR